MKPGNIRRIKTVRMSYADAIEYVEYHNWVTGLLPTSKHGLVTMPTQLTPRLTNRSNWLVNRFQTYSQMRLYENGKHHDDVHAHYRVVVVEPLRTPTGMVRRPYNDMNLKRSTKRVFYKSKFMPLEGGQATSPHIYNQGVRIDKIAKDGVLPRLYARGERVCQIMNRMNLAIEAYEVTGELQKLFDKLWQEDEQEYGSVDTYAEK